MRYIFTASIVGIPLGLLFWDGIKNNSPLEWGCSLLIFIGVMLREYQNFKDREKFRIEERDRTIEEFKKCFNYE